MVISGTKQRIEGHERREKREREREREREKEVDYAAACCHALCCLVIFKSV